MPVTNFFHTFVMSYLLVLNEFIFASLVLTYGRGMLQHLPFCVICAVNCLLCFHSLYSAPVFITIEQPKLIRNIRV